MWHASIGENRDYPPFVGWMDMEAAPEGFIVAAEREQAAGMSRQSRTIVRGVVAS